MCVVYKLSFKNGKVYIGKTNNLIRRIRRHIQDSETGPSKIYRAMRRHKLFCVDVLAENMTEAEAAAYEQQMIKEYDSYNSGYNSTFGGEGTSGYQHSETARQAMSAALKKWHAEVGFSDEVYKNWSIIRCGRASPRLGATVAKQSKSKMAFAKSSRPILAYKIGAINEFFYFRSAKVASEYIGVSRHTVQQALKTTHKTNGYEVYYTETL